jgi:hypothetical protein
MKPLKALRVKLKIGDMFESPKLHVLLTDEDDVIVARCLDFTVSSHGEDDNDALNSLAESIKEYILTSVEDGNIENLYDPAHNKYWKVFNELESSQERLNFMNSVKNLSLFNQFQAFQRVPAEVCYA